MTSKNVESEQFSDGRASPPAPSAWQLLLEEYRLNLEDDKVNRDSSVTDIGPLSSTRAPSAGKFGAIKRQARERRASLARRKETNLFGDVEDALELMNRGSLHKSNRATITEVLKKKGITTKLIKQPQQQSVVDHFVGKGTDGLSSQVPYQKQGNAEMYSEEQMMRRKELKNNSHIINTIDSWWFQLPKTTISRGLNFPMYVWLNRKLFFALVPTASDVQFRKTVKVDWQTDTDNGRTQVLNLDQFRSAMFQLADIWCETTDLTEYCDFVDRCRSLVVETDPPYTGSLEDVPHVDMVREASSLPSVPTTLSGRRKSSVSGEPPTSTTDIPGVSFLNPVARPSISSGRRHSRTGKTSGAGKTRDGKKTAKTSRESPRSARLPQLSAAESSHPISLSRNVLTGTGQLSLSPLSESPDRIRRRSEGDALGLIPNSSQSTTPSDLRGSSKEATPSPAAMNHSGLAPLESKTMLEVPSPKTATRRKSQSPTATLRLGRQGSKLSPQAKQKGQTVSCLTTEDRPNFLESFEAFTSPTTDDLKSHALLAPPPGQPLVASVRQRRLSGTDTPQVKETHRSNLEMNLVEIVTSELGDEEQDTKKQVALVLLNAVQLSEETEEAALEASFEEFRLKYELSEEHDLKNTLSPVKEEDYLAFFKARSELVLLMKEAAKQRVKRRRELLKSLGSDCELEGEITMGLDSPRDDTSAEHEIPGEKSSSASSLPRKDEIRRNSISYTTLSQKTLQLISEEVEARKERRGSLRRELFLLRRKYAKSSVEKEMGTTETWQENRLLLEHKESNNRLRGVVASAEDEEMAAEVLLATQMLAHCLDTSNADLLAQEFKTDCDGVIPPELISSLHSLIETVSASYSKVLNDISESQEQCLTRAKTTLLEHHDHECRREQAELQALQCDRTIPEFLRKECIGELKVLMKESAVRRMKENEQLRELEVQIGKSLLQKRSLLDEYRGMAEDEISALEGCERITDVISQEVLADRESFEPEGEEAGACNLIQSERFRDWTELVQHIQRRSEHWRVSQVTKSHADDTQRRTDVISFLSKIASQQWNRDVMARSEAMSRRMKLIANAKKMAKTQNYDGIRDSSVHQLIHKKLQVADKWEQAETSWITEKNERLSNIHRTGQLRQRQLAARVARLQEVFQILWASSARQTDLSAKLRSAKRNNDRFVSRQQRSGNPESRPVSGGVKSRLAGAAIGSRSSSSRKESISGTIGGAYDAELAVKEKQAERDRHAARVRFLRDQERAERERLKAERERRAIIGSTFEGVASPSRSPYRKERSPSARRPSSRSPTRVFASEQTSPQQASRERSRRALEVAERRAVLEAQHVVKTTVERSKYYHARGKVKTLTPQRRQSIQASTFIPPFGDSVSGPTAQPHPVAHPPSAPRPRGESFSLRKAVVPGDQLKHRIEQESTQYQRLDTTRRNRNLSVFEEKQKEFIANSLSNQDIYRASCEEHGIGENFTFTASLSTEPLNFDMSSLTCVGPLNLGSIKVLFDLLLMNPVQSLTLKDLALGNEEVKLLSEILLTHEFISFIDLRNNKGLNAQGGLSLKSLVSANPKIIKVYLQGSSIPTDLAAEITKICDSNAFNKHIGRTEFELLLADFNTLDTNRDGLVSRDEIFSATTPPDSSPVSPQTTTPRLLDQTASALEKVDFESATTCDSPLPHTATKTLGKIQDAAFKRIEKLNTVLLAVKEAFLKEGEQVHPESLSLVHLILLVYPQWTAERVVRLIKEYLLDPQDRNHYLQPYYSMTGHSLDLGRTASKLSLRQSHSSLGLGSGVPSPSHADESSKSSATSSLQPVLRQGFVFGDQMDDEGEETTQSQDSGEIEKDLEDELLDDLIDGQTLSELKIGPGGLPSLSSDSEGEDEETLMAEKPSRPTTTSTTGGSKTASVLPSLEELHGFIERYGDGDGYLTLAALADGLGMAGGDMTDLAQAFEEYDMDRDGKLSVDEFMRFMAA